MAAVGGYGTPQSRQTSAKLRSRRQRQVRRQVDKRKTRVKNIR